MQGMSKKSALAYAALVAPVVVYCVLVWCSVQYWGVPRGWVIMGTVFCGMIYILFVAFLALRMRAWSERTGIDRVLWMDGPSLFERLRTPTPSERTSDPRRRENDETAPARDP